MTQTRFLVGTDDDRKALSNVIARAEKDAGDADSRDDKNVNLKIIDFSRRTEDVLWRLAVGLRDLFGECLSTVTGIRSVL